MLDETLHQVKVIILLDGVEYVVLEEAIPAYAIPYVTSAAAVQVQDPDLESARDTEPA